MSSDVEWRHYVDRRFEDLDRRVTDRFDLHDQQSARADRALDARLHAMNEFRDALKDQANRMATRTELDKLNEDVQELRRDKANLDGRLLMLSGGASLIAGLVVWALTRVWP